MTIDEEFIWRYRFAHRSGNEASAVNLRGFCESVLGEANLHEIAFKEPMSAETIAERNQSLIKLTRSYEAELAWLATVQTVDGLPLADKRIRRKLDPERHVWRYRQAHDTNDLGCCQLLRKRWADQRGEDNLHEIAHRKPLSTEAVAERKLELIAKLRRMESELAWLETVDTA
jgi:hypothetical protein